LISWGNSITRVKIPLFQAIKDVPIYSKEVHELFLMKPGRKRKDAQTVHVMGKLSDLMLGVVLAAKYFDPSSLIVNVQINSTLITNTLIDLGIGINIVTCETMETLRLIVLRETPTVLQLAERSTIKLEGILEDVVFSADSWEYLAEFMILQPKKSFGGYPLILGRSRMPTFDAYIGCRSDNMIISHRTSTKKLTLYPPTKPDIDFETPL
jgi:hypothetical protein